MKKRVVITGVGVLSPIGNTVEEFYHSLKQQKLGIISVDNPEVKERSKISVWGKVKNLDVASLLDPKLVKRNDMFVLFALLAAKQAIQQARLIEDAIPLDRVGVMVGTGIGGAVKFYEGSVDFSKGKLPSPFFIPQVIANMAGSVISMEYGFLGINYSISTACATSNHILGNAYMHIRDGLADAIVVGGTESCLIPLTISAFSSAQALTPEEDPTRASRPWDIDRNGFTIAEGSAIFVLEDYDSAKRRGVPILAEFVGVGFSSDAYHITAPHPDGLGASLAMESAIKNAGIQKEQIDYVNAHGTSTPAGDIAEAKSIAKVFGKHSENLLVNSTKSYTGHLLGASGSIELLATLLALQEGFVHPTLGLKNIDPNCPIPIVTSPVQKPIEYALSNSFGFGGLNASIVVKKFSE